MTGAYDDVAAMRYARIESRPDSFSLRLAPRIERLLDRDRSPSNAPTMLDVGCGTGQLTDYFRQAGFATVGVDRSTPMLRHRVDHRSGRRGPVVMADAAQLPLVGQFDLITATFNVLNHLPDEGAAASLVGEVARLLAPAGLFVFDVDTELGLRRTSELIEIHAAESDHTVWRRRWAGNRLLLHATGSFLDGEIRHEYGETIEKLVVHTEQVDGWCAAAGLSRPSWRSDDLVTRLDEPERVSVAYGIVRGPAVRP